MNSYFFKRTAQLGLALALVGVVALASSACERKAPRLRATVTKAVDAQGRHVLQFAVSGDAPVPVRALDPVLVVAGKKLQNYRYGADGRTLSFVDHDLDTLATAESVAFAWQGEAARRGESKDGWHAQMIDVDVAAALK